MLFSWLPRFAGTSRERPGCWVSEAEATKKGSMRPESLIQGNSLPSQQMEHMLGLARQKKAEEEQDSEPG